MEDQTNILTSEEDLPDLPSEPPEQSGENPRWEFKPRKNPKWGEVTKRGLVVGRGANQRVIPPDEIYKLACLGATIEEMSDFFEVNRETLKYNFSDYIAKGRAELKRRLRAVQLKVALGGNPTMLIWLGRNILGQTENPINTDETKVLPWAD